MHVHVADESNVTGPQHHDSPCVYKTGGLLDKFRIFPGDKAKKKPLVLACLALL